MRHNPFTETLRFWHGTDQQSARDIVARGVDLELCDRGYFGKAFYVTPDKALAWSNYADWADDVEPGAVVEFELVDSTGTLDLRDSDDWDAYRASGLDRVLHRDDLPTIARRKGVTGVYDRSNDALAVYDPSILRVVKLHAAGEPQPNPKVRIRIGPEGDEFEDVYGTRPRGVPDWLIVSRPATSTRTRTGRTPPGMWGLTHVPTGLAVMKGLTKADATLAARVVGREMPFLEDVDEQVGPELLTRPPYDDALKKLKHMEWLLQRKSESLQNEAVPIIVDLLQHDLVGPKELAKLSPAAQVAIDAEMGAKERLPR